MITTRSFSYLLLTFTVLFFSCTPVRVISTQQEENVDYEDYQSFNFMDISFKNDSIEEGNDLAIKMLKEAIVREMEALGYARDEDPDLWINIGIVVAPKVQTRTTDFREAPVYIGQRRYHWESEEIVVDKYKEGTVSIDIIDAGEKARIWEGVAAGTLTDNLQKLEKRINKAMELLFNKFPLESGK